MAHIYRKTFTNKVLDIQLTSYIDKQQKIWFLGKEVCEILGYSKTRDALSRHVDNEDKKQLFTYHSTVQKTSTVEKSTVQQTWTVGKSGSLYTYINESGIYSLVLSSKLESAKKFKRWITSEVLPSIRKHGQYKIFDCPWNKMILIANETDLHYKVVQLIRNYYPDSLLVAGLGENQDTEEKRLDSYKKGYQRGQPDLMIMNYHKSYKGLCIEFKSPTNNYQVSEAQLKMKEKYIKNNYKFLLSNDYDEISKEIHEYMDGVRIPCEYCVKVFRNIKSLEKHYKYFHRIEKD